MAVLVDQLRYLVEDHPDEVAYRVVTPDDLDGHAMTFRTWDDTASRLARGLMSRGIVPGDRVALVTDPSDALHHLKAYAGIHKAGAVTVPVNTKMSRPEMAQVLAHAEPRVMIASPSRLEVATRLRRELESVEELFSTGDGEQGAKGWEDLLDTDPTDVQAPIDGDDPADIVYTSGTTGRPKGVLTRHRNAGALSLTKPEWNGMNWFHASPMFTSAGQSFIYVPMRLGMTGLYMSRFSAASFLDLVEQGRIQMAFLVPAMVELLLAREDIGERDLSGLNLVSVGSAPLAPASLQRLNDLLPNGSALNAFALTESGSAHIILPADEVSRRPGSVGRAIPPVEVAIVDEDGTHLPTGEVGEVWLRNPGREREYFRDPEATAETWQDGWLRSGDLGYLDEDGFLYIVGRRKDIIIRGGHNIHAVDVEAALYQHPGVAEAAVIGVPNPVLGEDVAAVVVRTPNTEVDEAELIAWCEERVASYAVPRSVSFRDELPRNPTGKVLKDRLRIALTDGGDQVPK